MPYLKTILLLIAGFAVPVGIAVMTGPGLFSSSSGTSYTSTVQKDRPSAAEVDASSAIEARMLQVPKGSSFASVEHDPLLDPAENKLFLVSFAARFDELPRIGKREILVVKYAGQRPPHSGWAISVKRRATSLRPEVYWVGPDGQGGWYSFEDLDLKPGVWYVFTTVAKPNQFMNFFVEELSAVTGAASGGVRFAGGYDLAGIRAPSSGSSLDIGAVQEGSNGFSGDVGLLLIAHLSEIPKRREDLVALASGSPKAIASRISTEDIALWIGRDGTDLSRYNRTLVLNGSAVWHPM